MAEFVQSACDGKPKSEVEELNLEGQDLQNQLNELTGFDSLKSLELTNCSLSSMEKFPEFPALTELVLRNNQIKGSLSFLNKSCPLLEKLNLSDNKIENLVDLEPLKNLENLKIFKLVNNEVVNTEGFIDKVGKLLPQLATLQTTEADSEEEEEGSDEDSEMGLQDLVERTLEDESDDEDFVGEGEEDDEEIEDEEEEEDCEDGEEKKADISNASEEDKSLKRKAEGDNGTEQPVEKK